MPLTGRELELAECLLHVPPTKHRLTEPLAPHSALQKLDGLVTDADVLFGEETIQIGIDRGSGRSCGSENSVGSSLAVDNVDQVAEDV